MTYAKVIQKSQNIKIIISELYHSDTVDNHHYHDCDRKTLLFLTSLFGPLIHPQYYSGKRGRNILPLPEDGSVNLPVPDCKSIVAFFCVHHSPMKLNDLQTSRPKTTHPTLNSP